MEILWWLAPSAVVAVLAMCWVAWLGRHGRGEVDPEVAVARLAQALERDRPTPHRPPARERDRSAGVAVRPSRGTGSPTGARSENTPRTVGRSARR